MCYDISDVFNVDFSCFQEAIVLKYDPLTKCVDLEMSNSGEGIYYLYAFVVNISNIISIFNALHCIVLLIM